MPTTSSQKINQQSLRFQQPKMPKKQNWQHKAMFDAILIREKEARK
jgi:hypothetical protein